MNFIEFQLDEGAEQDADILFAGLELQNVNVAILAQGTHSG